MNPNFPRIGFHYFPDTAHYRQIDLDTWLPELQRLGAGSVVLLAPPTHAIPELFIAGLISAGIEPVVHFPFHCRANTAGACPSPETLRLLLNAYARWGVRRVAFFDRPNLRGVWSPADWLQGDLVERFLDLFLPVAALAIEAGLSPVFPPLAPGGDYWDLSFLRSALRGLKRRSAGRWVDQLILSAEAFSGDRPLEWGGGGPDRWPAARPYHTPEGDQDHLGFRIFEWYLSIARQELGQALPILLLRAGKRYTWAGPEVTGKPVRSPGLDETAGHEPADSPAPIDGRWLAAGADHARQNLAVAEMLAEDPENGGLPAEVLAAHFWLLSAEPRSAAASESWFPPAGLLLPVVSAFQAWAAHRLGLQPVAPAAPGNPTPAEPDAATAQDLASPALGAASPAPGAASPGGGAQDGDAAAAQPDPTPDSPAPVVKTESIDHYILLPLYAWGAADWDLALIQPLIHQGHPTIGFSLSEARLSRRVTVVGGPGAVSTEALEMLRRNGCHVDRLLEDGTLIASG